MKRLPFLTSAQRRALLIVEWLLLIGIIGYSLWRTKTPEATKVEVAERREWHSAPVKSFTYAEKERPVETFPFDPNTADSTTLLRLGLSPWQVRSIYRYRAKLGRYHTPEDFMRLPNMTVEQWERLKDFIRIAPQFRYVEPPSHKSYRRERSEKITYATESAERDTAKANLSPRGSQESAENHVRREAVKLSPGQTIDINSADTTQLKLIPGIASKRAARIVAYRKSLGGFVSVEQAMEAIEMPDSVLHYMTVTPVELAKLNVNRLSVQQLMKHPYLNFYQAKAIFEHRRNKGNLQSIEDLKHLDAFRPSDIDRLQPYIEF